MRKRLLQLTLLAAVTVLALGMLARPAEAGSPHISVNFSSGYRQAPQQVSRLGHSGYAGYSAYPGRSVVVRQRPVIVQRDVYRDHHRPSWSHRDSYRRHQSPAAVTTTTTTTTTVGRRSTITTTTTTTTTNTPTGYSSYRRMSDRSPRTGGITIVIGR